MRDLRSVLVRPGDTVGGREPQPMATKEPEQDPSRNRPTYVRTGYSAEVVGRPPRMSRRSVSSTVSAPNRNGATDRTAAAMTQARLPDMIGLLGPYKP